MNVVTFNEQDLERASEDLAVLLSSAGPFDLVVGVETGGAVVAQLVYERLMSLQVKQAAYATVVCRRPGSVKKKEFRLLLRVFPYFVTDVLRVLEMRWGEFRSRRRIADGVCGRSVDVKDDVMVFASAEPIKILLLDDAVDSGETLLCVVSKLRQIYVSAAIFTACITSTYKKAMFAPDFKLYENVIVRFPWSVDFHG